MNTLNDDVITLDSRTGDNGKIMVDLVWDRPTNALIVAVNDRETDEMHFIPCRDGKDALEKFAHPFAHVEAAC